MRGLLPEVAKVLVLLRGLHSLHSQQGVAGTGLDPHDNAEASPTRASNVVAMPNRSPNQNPEALSAAWRAIHKLEGDIKDLRGDLSRPSLWSRLWAERAWLIPTTVGILLTIFGLTWYVGGLAVDKHIQSALAPVHSTVERIDKDVQLANDELKILQAQIATIKYLNVPATGLKAHRSELSQLKSSLATTPKTTPNFWPTTFQIIELLSKSVSGVEPNNRQESVFDDVSGFNPSTAYIPEGSRILLKNRITNSVFENVIVRFDPSVILRNVTFINCVLILPAQPNPPQNLQSIAETLLTSDVSKVTVGVS